MPRSPTRSLPRRPARVCDADRPPVPQPASGIKSPQCSPKSEPGQPWFHSNHTSPDKSPETAQPRSAHPPGKSLASPVPKGCVGWELVRVGTKDSYANAKIACSTPTMKTTKQPHLPFILELLLPTGNTTIAVLSKGGATWPGPARP